MRTFFAVKLIRMSTGERHYTLIDAVSRIPMFAAALFSLTELRALAGSHGTIAQTLRGVAELLNFLAARRIVLAERITSRQFLSAIEIDGLMTHLFRAGRKRSVGNGTVAIRLGAILAYLQWLIDMLGVGVCSAAERRVARTERRDFLSKLARRRPKARQGKGGREGLSDAQLSALFKALHKIADAADRSGIVARIFAADRALLWFEFLIEFGFRTGELLSLKVSDFDFRRLILSIERQPDDPDDERRDNPRVKGMERELPLSPYLAKRTEAHIRRWRHLRRGRSRDGFLFVSSSGRPLSRSSVTRLFERLRADARILGDGFCNHIMRHTWNAAFSEAAKATGLTAEDEAEARATIMGWSDPRTARNYLRSRRRKQLAAITLHCQANAKGLRRHHDA